MEAVSHGGEQQDFIHIDTLSRQLPRGISNRARVLGLERTSSTIYQTRGPAWREAIVSNLISMQRPRSVCVRGLYGRSCADCDHRLELFGPSGQVWRAGSDISPLQSCEICAEVEDPTFRDHLIEKTSPQKWQMWPRNRLAGAEYRRVCLHRNIVTRQYPSRSDTRSVKMQVNHQ